ncbi:hydroxypyruvate isomerase [Sphingomonas sp. Root710]|uniref:2-oxo-tetronate isomerase n=1 Tax=Sphingomonas sp. Root710 TaxID=1736594 RepID=UPI0006FEE489|nr:2-oxo-tetronate isomerase [Sphingomonas sp. Root710]KRB82990.1 hydroxypyruvate isomerase [Sphingomonas sp. Root710]
MPRFSANLSFLFQELPFLERFDAAGQAGFDAVEFLFPYDFPVSDLGNAARRAGVDIVLFNAAAGDLAAGDFGLAAMSGRGEEFRAQCGVALDYARQLGCARLHVMAGKVSAYNEEARETYKANLTWAAGEFAKNGIALLVEPLNPRSVPGYFLSDFDQAADIIDELALPNLKLQFDIFHRQILHGDVTEALRRLLPLIGHVQTASVPERHEPGSGELDDAYIFAMLDAWGYPGFVGAEYHPAGATGDGLGWFAPYRRRP